LRLVNRDEIPDSCTPLHRRDAAGKGIGWGTSIVATIAAGLRGGGLVRAVGRGALAHLHPCARNR
jgi:hypothetical protein